MTKKNLWDQVLYSAKVMKMNLQNHIKVMQEKGFPLTGKAGYDIAHLFSSRHSDITIRKSKSVSVDQ